MGQNSSIDVGTSKLDPDKEYIIVDASDSCVSGVKLRSTGIIPISELIKQEKCSKNIQKIEQTYYSKKKSGTKQPKENLKSKKGKPDFIETSFEDVPTRRQWVRVDSEPKKPFESDAVKIGLKKPSKTALKNDKQIGVQNGFQDNNRDHSKEHNKELNKEHNREGIRDSSRNRKRENSRNAKREHTRANSRHAKRETIRDEVREDARPSTRKEVRKNIGIGTADTLRRNNKNPEKKLNIDVEQSIKSILKNNVIEHRFKENATQTITTTSSYENVKQLYKRNDNEEKKRSRNKQPQPQQKQFKQHRDFEEESTHQFQTHEFFHPKRKLRRHSHYGDNLKIETMISCAIPPEEYHHQWQTISNEGGRKLGRQPGRNYINRKLAGAYYSRKEKYVPYKNDVNSLNSYEYDMLPPSVTLLPTSSTSEEAIREHSRKYVSAKEALESWKNLHTWKQHVKRFEKSRNDFHHNNFDVATQTLSHCPKNIVRSNNNRSNHYLPTISMAHDDFIMPSEKHLYKDFIAKMENCLQNHSRLCELSAKRNGEGKFTWVQDKYRRWHKISFDDFKK